jgi:hypothetical protein
MIIRQFGMMHVHYPLPFFLSLLVLILLFWVVRGVPQGPPRTQNKVRLQRTWVSDLMSTAAASRRFMILRKCLNKQLELQIPTQVTQD